MSAHDMLTRCLEAARHSAEIHWVVEQPADAALLLRRCHADIAHMPVQFRCQATQVSINVPKAHLRCCLVRHDLNEQLGAVARCSGVSESEQRAAAVRRLLTASDSQRERPRSTGKMTRRIYTNRPPPLLRLAADHNIQCRVCLAPALTLQVTLNNASPSPESAARLSQQHERRVRALARRMAPLFLGVRVSDATLPFISKESTHEELPKGASGAANVSLLPLQSLDVGADGTVTARYAQVEYGLSATPRRPSGTSTAGVKRRHTSDTPVTVRDGSERPTTGIPLAFGFFLPVLAAHGNGWTSMAQSVERLQTYNPQACPVERYALHTDAPLARKFFDAPEREPSARVSGSPSQKPAAKLGPRQKVALRRRPSQLLDAFLAAARASSPGTDDPHIASDVVQVTGCDGRQVLSVKGHPSLTLQSLATLRSSQLISIEPCALPNSIVLSSILPPTVFSPSAAGEGGLTPVHTLADMVAALEQEQTKQ